MYHSQVLYEISLGTSKKKKKLGLMVMTLYMLGHLLKDERVSKFDNTYAILTRNVTGLSLLEKK